MEPFGIPTRKNPGDSTSADAGEVPTNGTPSEPPTGGNTGPIAMESATAAPIAWHETKGMVSEFLGEVPTRAGGMNVQVRLMTGQVHEGGREHLHYPNCQRNHDVDNANCPFRQRAPATGEVPTNGTPGEPLTGGNTGGAQGTQGANDDDAMRKPTSADAGAGCLQTYNVVITAADYPVLCALSGEKDLMELGVKALRNNVFNDETKEEQRQPYALFNVDTRKWKELHNGLWLCTEHDPECAAGESGGKCRACKYKENRNANRQPVDVGEYDTLTSLSDRFGPCFPKTLQVINGLEDYPLDKSLKLLPKKWVSPDLRDGEKPPQRHLLVPRNKIFGRNSKYSGKMTPGGASLMVICILHEPKCIVKKFIKKAYQLVVDDDAAQKGGTKVSQFFKFFEDLEISMKAHDTDNTSEKSNDLLPEYWEDGHFNGHNDEDPMVRLFTPKDATGEQMERMGRRFNEMTTSQGGGKWEQAKDRRENNLWPKEVVRDKAELEQCMLNQNIELDELEKPECPEPFRQRATAYTLQTVDPKSILNNPLTPTWLQNFIEKGLKDGFTF
ncbi:hypothetical protein CYMTET_13463 [Cymbomonas tetramitiformis]|uniref:Uncharacterized protein n=1 Tax=Cymbomonas tetramitiformis TaxID=36881 RepID=A0AAE0GIG0_9CHLO|nr:hypothetical protein CYMTET_13463 [Cymbomonas tetramitiformis]